MPRQPANPLKAQAILLRQQGLSYGQISKQLGVKEGSIPFWVASEKKKKLAAEAKASFKNSQSAELAPYTQNPIQSKPNLSDISAGFKSSPTPPQGSPELSEIALRAKALAIVAEGSDGRRIRKDRKEWAEWALSVTSKAATAKAGKESGKDSAYSGMGDAELAERAIAGACAMLGGPAVDAIIMRLKDQGQFNIG